MSVKEVIIHFLEENYGSNWEYAGRISRRIHDLTGSKESIIERRCRELVQSGILEVRYVKIDGEGSRFCQYRIKQIEKPVLENKIEETQFIPAELPL